MNHNIKTEVHMVGCGGVFYHGIPAMVCWLNRRGKTVGRIHLYDPDKVEERNGLRQWGRDVGERKVAIAQGILLGLGVQQHIMGHPEAAPPMSFDKDMQQLVVVIPDNHLTRVRVFGELRQHQEDTNWKYPAVCITGGNTLMDGYAYSSMFGGGTIWCNWLLRHHDIREEAVAEATAEALRLEEGNTGCANTPGPDEQTVLGNTLTAACIWSLVEEAMGYEKVGEMRWFRGESGDIKIVNYVKLCSRWTVDDLRMVEGEESKHEVG